MKTLLLDLKHACDWPEFLFFCKRFSITFTLLILFSIESVFSQSESAKIKISGTGNTTGHVANLTIVNDQAQSFRIAGQTAYIPSSGGYQPYIVTIPESTIPANGTTTIPINGYCADVHTPPVPNGIDMPPVDTWVPIGDPVKPIPPGTTNIIPGPTKPNFTPEDIPGITNTPGYTPDANRPDGTIQPTWPGTDIPVGGTIDPGDFPETFAPVIVGAFQKIGESVDVIINDPEYPTPFEGQPLKEREAVIQQTFWIYMASVTGSEYTRGIFKQKVYNQFTAATGQTVAALPEDKKEEMDEGIDQFWNVFTAVGVEAKVLKEPEGITDSSDDPVLINEGGNATTVVDELSNTDKYKQEMKNCFFSKLEYSVVLVHIYSRGTGKNEKKSKDAHYPNEKNEIEIKLKKGDTLQASIVNPVCTCLCWSSVDSKTQQKSGSYCECSITGISQSSFESKAFTDLLEPELDKAALDSLKKEIQKKIDDLKKANGKKSDIDKLQKQLDDEKKLRKENAARLQELKKSMNGPWRKEQIVSQSEFAVKAGFFGQVEFIFDVQGNCKGDDTCKSATFSREVRIKVSVPK